MIVDSVDCVKVPHICGNSAHGLLTGLPTCWAILGVL